jgi:vacuolar iron transporter family protein
MKNVPKELTGKELRIFKKAQQNELDAVELYKILAEKISETQFRNTFLSMAADEEKHAAFFKDYTKIVLTPKKNKARLVLFLYQILGLNGTLEILEKGELKAAEKYSSLQKRIPELQDLIQDEIRHSKTLRKLR